MKNGLGVKRGTATMSAADFKNLAKKHLLKNKFDFLLNFIIIGYGLFNSEHTLF